MAIREYHPTKDGQNGFPRPGEPNVLYVDESTGRRYWWKNSQYEEGFYFRINGVDISDFIDAGGIKYTRNDIDAAKAGRTLSGYMYRGRVTMKVKLEIKCRSLTQSECQTLMRLIYPEYVSVEYYDPKDGRRRSDFYSNNVPATTCSETEGGDIVWNDISFPLIER